MTRARETKLDCARCRVQKFGRACDSENGIAPGGCPTTTAADAVAAATVHYQEPEIGHFTREASRQEADSYTDHDGLPRATRTRVEEVIALARRLGCQRLGLAFCAGLLDEARILAELLTGKGFEVVSVVCKVGCVAKEELGLAEHEKIRPGQFESMCNPIAQAELLNRAGTELNIMLGLCVGHDALFLKHVTGYTTVLAVKDRVLAHNPMAAIYNQASYYRWLHKPEEPAE